jgi:alkanesulfonate monooxygenase SsuD/methylene tetrahydromethanopterin reductase-like flavin-dependent oxidoreductase (luciferase family)
VLQLGVSLPQTDIGGDPLVVKEFATTAEALGFSHLAVYDHVIGINPQARPDWRGPYTSGDCFHDPFALFGFLASCTRSIELSTHVLIVSQRQTVLVATSNSQAHGTTSPTLASTQCRFSVLSLCGLAAI